MSIEGKEREKKLGRKTKLEGWKEEAAKGRARRKRRLK